MFFRAFGHAVARIALLSLAAYPVGLLHAAEPPSHGELFDAIHKIVADAFFDPQLRGVDWQAVGDEFRPRAVAADSREAFAHVINDMLATLKTSHTDYLTPDMPKYYELLGVFESSSAYREQLDQVRSTLPQQKIGYVGIGIDTLETEEGDFVASVFDGGPAALAGIVVGDRIVSVAGQEFHLIRSFAASEGQRVELQIQRLRDGPVEMITVVPQFLAGATMFMEAMKQSARVLPQDGFKIGYIHAWSYSGKQYHELLTESLFGGTLDGVDALLLDLRDGWGGASVAYLNLFNRNIPQMVMTLRDGSSVTLDQQWRKPVALLINARVRSGKETLVFGFKQLERGPVIGQPTAGAVTAGALRFLPDHSLLYLAVGDVLVDGQRLEGKGVTPTLPVERPIPFSAGRDPQYEAGVEVLIQILRASATR